MPLNTGEILQNRYRIARPLGRGGMGAVYRAWHLRFDLPVAVKEMTPQPGLDADTLAQLRQQFQHEAAVLARLDHPHLVGVMDFFEEGGNVYLVMHFVEGESLAERIEREGPLPEDQVLVWAAQLLDALAYCHSQGMIHRDIKPQNVIIRPDGRAVLVDFGLVKLWDPHDPRTRTAMRGMGTPEYAPPEQYGTQPGHTDPRSDLYSLGATLYHALTGQSPPSASDRMAFPDQFAPVREWNVRVSRTTEAAVLRAMELAVGNRFPTAQDFAAALRGTAAPEKRKARPSPSGRGGTKVMPDAPPVARQRRRVPAWAWAVGGLAVVALLIALGTGIWGGKTPSAPTGDGPTTATRTEPARPAPSAGAGATRVRDADGMVMVSVPAGEFEMGSPEGADDQRPVHTVALDAFWLDRTEVTNGQFAAFLNDRGNREEAGVTWLNLEDADCPIEQVNGKFLPWSRYTDHPVMGVTWYGAASYCAWAGARLPTEAEWEYAARGPEGQTYPWGDEGPTCDRAQYTGCAGDAVPVGSLPDGASWCGALDMAGNVWEWVVDWYGDYPSERQTNPTGPETGTSRVLRGGSWDYDPKGVRSAVRRRSPPASRSKVHGFRCAMGSP